ncbi:uncharacterized protein LOC143618732 [Bidens hawaiensis]|uniref:uncharacterized protein LOC143618732 n=1 Tax=Bidens hawaiensis TaxID=980011 RepID=UPI00404B37B5
MGKVMWIEDGEGFDQRRPSDHPGCMSGIFYALDYHYWQSNVKKILPHRKHEDFVKHTKRNRRYQRISDDQDHVEVLKVLDTKTSHIQMNPRDTKTNSTQKRSLKARIKSFVSEHNNKPDQDSVPTPKLHRTYSIHHLESNEWVQPIIFFPENAPEKDESNVNKSQDILDMFKVDKKLFINTLQDRSSIRPKLTKSGSFPMKLKDKLNETYNVSKHEKIKNSNDDIIRLRRICSLNESADRYTRIFDFNKEATLRSSRSLKLTNGSESVLSSLRRNNSNQESRDGYFVRSFSQNERDSVSLHKDYESLSEVMDKSDEFLESGANSRVFGKYSQGLEVEEDYIQISPDGTVQISEGLDLLTNSHENLKKELKTINSKKHMDLSTKDVDFSYVKKILEHSGFLKNGLQQTWYSSNQPLDPFVFQELESQHLHDPERFAEEINELSHRLLIFDLVDEVLVTMYETSFSYYPKKLSTFCHIRHDPSGSLVLDEVWTRISRLINMEHDMNESLNDIVARDVRSDGWMNLHSDLEFVGLDLEDVVLDDLLEELLFEFF